MFSHSLSIIILAAGKGTRMKSAKAKVLHEVFHAPMIHHVLDSVLPLRPATTVVVVGHQKAVVKDALDGYDIVCALQENQLGTGHAVLAAQKHIPDTCKTVMILCGDTPLVRAKTLQDMCDLHRQQGSGLTLMTTVLDDPTNYGRILCTGKGHVTGIVEQKDASEEQLGIKEINAGIYCVDKTFLFTALKKVGTDNSQGEVYLTDVVALAVESGVKVEKFMTDIPVDVLGVNSRIELAYAHRELQQRRNRELMLQGVTMLHPDTTSVSPDSTVGQDTLLEPGVHISGSSSIGNSCSIGQGAIIKGCRVGAGVTIGAYSYLIDKTIEPGSSLAPYSRNS
jgi:bifunctional UDP-N-acetylglucosamine pyrophosphorylase/glucosamine-1-phosphate N-acetyltransferase